MRKYESKGIKIIKQPTVTKPKLWITLLQFKYSVISKRDLMYGIFKVLTQTSLYGYF